ncbi:MAG: Ni/Fe-hydrogenase, b-type cytochrome subunit [Vicinamibacterales bacterium]
MATTFRRVYVWERPVRLYHWVNALSVTLLVCTGLLIGNPPTFLTSREAWTSQWFGTVRFLHFSAAYVFVFAFLLRVYWMLVGNEHARWFNFLPVTPRLLRGQAQEVGRVLRSDILLIETRPYERVGHNALAAWSYALVFAATIFQTMTGFGLYAPMSGAWLPTLFAWIVPLLGGDANVRQWHHAASWFFVAFTLVHVYLTVYHDTVEGRGEISSMVSGTKFLPVK